MNGLTGEALARRAGDEPGFDRLSTERAGAAISTSYRPDIDGLRAVAVLCVLFFHAGMPGFPGGFVGVDVFFVISGFLITGLILSEIERTGRVSISGFYSRRIRRLFPALLFTLTWSAAAAALLLTPDDLRSFAISALAALCSVSNFHFWLESGYFDSAAELKPLLHTWSLGVEEQFYLVWPAILALLAATGTVRHAFKIVGVLFLCSLGLAWALQSDRSASFYLAPFRVYELAIGAALCRKRAISLRGGAAQDAALLAGLALIAAGVVLFDSGTHFPGINALVPCLGAALVILGGQGRAGQFLLGNRASVGIGLVSYSLYLAHWPLLAFARYANVGDLSTWQRLGVCAASLALAAGMYRWVEQPFRHPRPNFRESSRPFPLAIVGLTVAIAVVLGSGWQSGGWPQRIARDYDNPAVYAGDRYKWQQTVEPAGASRGTIVLYGDSHARQYASGLGDLAGRFGYTLQLLTHGACMSLPGVTNIYQGEVAADCRDFHLKLRATPDASLVVIAYGWPKVVSVGAGAQVIDGIDEDNIDAYLTAVLNGLSGLIAELDDHVPVLVIGDVPSARLRHGYPWCADRPLRSSACHKSYPRAEGEFEAAILRFRAFAAKYPGRVYFLDPYDSLCDARTCYVVKDRTLYYSDHAHLTPEGARRVTGANPGLFEQLLQWSEQD